MTVSRRHLGLVVAVIAAAALLSYLRWSTRVEGGTAQPPVSTGAQAAGRGLVVGEVQIDRLEGRSQTRRAPERDVFRFESRRAPASAPQPARGASGTPAVAGSGSGPPQPSGPPPPPPIPLRYIGFVDQAGEAPRVAVLSDGRGNVFNGREGDIIEGRYRLLRIGTDSADLIYVDGRGRQTIRLSGQ